MTEKLIVMYDTDLTNLLEEVFLLNPDDHGKEEIEGIKKRYPFHTYTEVK